MQAQALRDSRGAPSGEAPIARSTQASVATSVLNPLLAVAWDNGADNKTRARMLQAIGRLGAWNREVADLARDEGAPAGVRRAAVMALNSLKVPEAERSRKTLAARFASREDSTSASLLRALR